MQVYSSTLGSACEVGENNAGVQVEVDDSGADAVVVADRHIDPSGQKDEEDIEFIADDLE